MTTPLTFHFNNSSLPWLGCSRRYKYQVVDGLVVPSAGKSKPLRIGSTFHKFMELIGAFNKNANKTISLLDLMMDESLWPADAATIDRSIVLQLIEGAHTMYNAHPELYADCIREWYFERPVNVYIETADAGLEEAICNDCGTLDLVSYLASEDAVLVTDYKTTEKDIDGSHVSHYNLSSQRFFYESNLLALAEDDPKNSLPAHYQQAIKAGRLKFAYWFYNYKTKTDVLMPHQYVNFDVTKKYAPLFAEKRQLAAYLHLHPDQSEKEGITTGACYFCPFSGVCELHDDNKEAEQIEKWPYGREKYVPRRH